MKILLFGCNGQVGWELQRSLAVLGEVIALDFDSTDLSADFSRITLPAPMDNAGKLIEGEGWKLELNSGWVILPGDRGGDFKVRPVR